MWTYAFSSCTGTTLPPTDSTDPECSMITFSQWGRDFQHQSPPVLRPTQPALQRVPGLLLGAKAARARR